MPEIFDFIATFNKDTKYLNGYCFDFYLILKNKFNSAKPYYDEDHVITEINGKFYDVTGEVQKELHLLETEERLTFIFNGN